jgi:hypothetical protein
LCITAYFAKNKTRLKTLFTIGSDAAESDTLLLELGPDYCCYAFLNHSQKAFRQISYISFDEMEMEQELVQGLDYSATGSSVKLLFAALLHRRCWCPKNILLRKNRSRISYTKPLSKPVRQHQRMADDEQLFPSFFCTIFLKSGFPKLFFSCVHTGPENL